MDFEATLEDLFSFVGRPLSTALRDLPADGIGLLRDLKEVKLSRVLALEDSSASARYPYRAGDPVRIVMASVACHDGVEAVRGVAATWTDATADFLAKMVVVLRRSAAEEDRIRESSATRAQEARSMVQRIDERLTTR